MLNQCTVFRHWITTILVIKEKIRRGKERKKKGAIECSIELQQTLCQPKKLSL